jgi:hypothetical protein
MTNPIKSEPAALAGFLPALATGIIQLLGEFKVPVTQGQAAAIVSLIAVIAGFWVRSRVSPVKPPEPPQAPPSDKTPPTGTHRLLGVVAALGIVGCSSTPAKPPCDPATAARLAAVCVLDVQTECVDRGVPEEDCIPLKECQLAADERQRECLQ